MDASLRAGVNPKDPASAGALNYSAQVLVLIPLPTRDFDPSESAIPWKQLTAAGHEVVFATPDGTVAKADEATVSGRRLGPLQGLLRARADARSAYAEMERADAFRAPLSYNDLGYNDLDAQQFDAIVLPGGHAPGMKPYLESPQLQRCVCHHMNADRPLGAICHGVLVLARSIDPDTGRSVLDGRRSTALTRMMEMSSWMLTTGWMGNHYRTYPEPVQDEVERALGDPARFIAGPSGMRGLLDRVAPQKDAPGKLSRGFIVQDGNYLSARWPGDVYAFSDALLRMLTTATRAAS
jgi:protease I